jgi:hypothetical protein
MTNVQENPGAQRTRRNIVKAAPILASAVAVSLATTRNALAIDKEKDKDKDKDKRQRQRKRKKSDVFPEGNEDSDG